MIVAEFTSSETVAPEQILSHARAVAEAVLDPELPFLSLGDLGIIREARYEGDLLIVSISPTYVGCPATQVIQQDVDNALEEAGFRKCRVETRLSPAWSTDWISEAGREKLKANGIAPPERGSPSNRLFESNPVACPSCGSVDTSRVSEFGATPCKALWRCTTCREPFESFKCH